MMENIFAQALNLESPWYIKSTNFDYQKKRLDIEIDFKRGAKFEYVNIEGEIKEGSVYDTKNKTWRHLNFFQHECYLNARIPRILKEDNKVEMIEAPWEGKIKGFTLLFEAMLLQLCTAMPVLKVSQISGVSDDKIWLMLERYVDQAVSNIEYKVNNKVHEKGYKNKPLTESQKISNKNKSKIRVRVEHVFGFMEQSMNKLYVKSIGEKRAEGYVSMVNLTYNLFRYEQIHRIKGITMSNWQ